MTHHDHHSDPPTSAEDWDARYSGEDGAALWSGAPNASLVTEVEGMGPGVAIDLGCGEGGDAIWLAKQGWEATGVDISRVALDRARRSADSAGVSVDWVQADFVEQPPAAGSYDLVTTHYPALLKSRAGDAIRALLQGVAPGGTLLVVGHDVEDPGYARSHGFEPDDYLQPGDVAQALSGEWTIEVHETRPRATPPSGQSPHAGDVILKARRMR